LFWDLFPKWPGAFIVLTLVQGILVAVFGQLLLDAAAAAVAIVGFQYAPAALFASGAVLHALLIGNGYAVRGLKLDIHSFLSFLYSISKFPDISVCWKIRVDIFP